MIRRPAGRHPVSWHKPSPPWWAVALAVLAASVAAWLPLSLSGTPAHVTSRTHRVTTVQAATRPQLTVPIPVPPPAVQETDSGPLRAGWHPTPSPKPTVTIASRPVVTESPIPSSIPTPAVTASASPVPTPVAFAAAPTGSAQHIAAAMLPSFGWPASEMACLIPLWDSESGWSPTALNRGTGATGIPQLNPSAHTIPPDWSNPTVQIRWGLGYIASVYGSPCRAWQHEQAIGWY